MSQKEKKQSKGPLGPVYTHDEEFANEYSTIIRRRRIYNFNLIFCETPFFVNFLDLLVGFRKFYIFLKSLGWRKNIRRIVVEYSLANSSPCVDGPLNKLQFLLTNLAKLLDETVKLGKICNQCAEKNLQALLQVTRFSYKIFPLKQICRVCDFRVNEP